MRTALTARSLITPTARIEHPLVRCEDGRITAIETRETASIPANHRHVDFADGILAPGYIDIHVHGGSGHDFMTAESSDFGAIERYMARQGVTSYCPTTVTASMDRTLAALERIAGRIEKRSDEVSSDGHAAAVPLGIHLEGPFISPLKRGVHPTADLQAPSAAAFERLWQSARGHIKVLTIAPELPGSDELIAVAAARGVVASLGHSDANAEAARRGIASGARHATHTFNAMRALDHREPGLLGLVLTDARLSADIIADGVHVDPAIIRLFLTSKGKDSAILITDAISASGMPDGEYTLGYFKVHVKDGRCVSDGKLAGSVLTMQQAVRNIMRFAEWTLEDAVRLATANPARLLGHARKGTLAVGSDADFVVLSEKGDLLKTVVGAGMRGGDC